MNTMEKLNYEAVVISVDSVLFDLNTFKQQVYAQVMTKHQLEIHPYFFELLLDGGYQQTERAYIHYNQYRAIRKELEETYDNALQEALDNNEIKPYPESIEFINWISKLDLKLGFISSYHRKIVEQLIDKYPVNLKIDALIAGNEVFEGKPEKDIYSKVAKKLKADPHYTLAIDATVNGVQGAYLSNMMSVYVEIHKLRVEKAQKFSNFQCPSLHRVKSLI
jgi:HAD superfamily hydrolase (TIGR01509 family)